MKSAAQSPGDPGSLRFSRLPAYAEYLLKDKTDELVKEQLRLAREVDFPLLKHLSSLSEEELFEVSAKSSRELLGFMAENRLDAYITQSIERWVNSYLPLITRDQILAEDITLGNYIRKTAYAKFIPGYTQDVREAIALLGELDVFVQHAELASIRTVMVIQQEKINEINRALKQKKDQLLEAQEIAGIGSFEWDATGQGNSSFTQQVFRIFEMEETSNLEDFLGYVHPGDRERVARSVREALEGKNEYDCEYRYSRNGKNKTIWSRGIVEFRDGKPVVMKGTIMDVTSRNEMLARLQQTSDELARLNISLLEKNKELERNNKELSSFSYIASHDLQEPLRKIQTLSGRIMEKELSILSDSGRDYFARIQKSASRMQQLINDLLQFSHTNLSVSAPGPVDLEALLNELRAAYGEAIAEGKAKIESGGLPVISAVQFQVRQLFDNLLSNAIKYTRPGVTAVVNVNADYVSGETLTAHGADAGRQYCRISITDNGIGFEQVYADKIFEMFQRLNGKDEFPGTGIGLAICKKIAENHGGFIIAQGRPGEGATFEVYFPD